MRRACFFARVADRDLLHRIEFYRQDLEILESLGFEVEVATGWSEIPAGCDLYFVWWWNWAFLPLLRARLPRRPVVITGVFDYRWPVPGLDYAHRPAWQRWLLRSALRWANANVFVSRSEYESVCRELVVQNAVYVPLVLHTEAYTPGDGAREDLILTVAWLQRGKSERKCIPELLRAVPHVLAAHPGVRFVLAGQLGPGHEELVTLCRQLGVASRVEFRGVVSLAEKVALMQRCKVYLQPSVYEGFGLAVLEAMGCGAPVVSSPVGEIPEVVGDAGLLVDGRSPEAIAAAVNRLLKDDRLREELGKRARRRVKELFPFERRRRELGALLGRLLDDRAR